VRRIKIGQDKNFQSAPRSVGKQYRLSTLRGAIKIAGRGDA